MVGDLTFYLHLRFCLVRSSKCIRSGSVYFVPSALEGEEMQSMSKSLTDVKIVHNDGTKFPWDY